MAVDMVNSICTCALGHNEVQLVAQPDGSKTCSVTVPSGNLSLLPGCPHGGAQLCTGPDFHKEYRDLVAAKATVDNQVLTLEGQVTTLTQEKADAIAAHSGCAATIAEKDTAIQRLTQERDAALAGDVSDQEAISRLTQEKNDAIAAHANCGTEKAALEQSNQTLTTQNAALTQEKTNLEGQVTTLTQEKTNLEGQVTTLTQEKNDAIAAHSGCAATIAEKDALILNLNNRLDEYIEAESTASNLVDNSTGLIYYDTSDAADGSSIVAYNLGIDTAYIKSLSAGTHNADTGEDYLKTIVSGCLVDGPDATHSIRAGVEAKFDEMMQATNQLENYKIQQSESFVHLMRTLASVDAMETSGYLRLMHYRNAWITWLYGDSGISSIPALVPADDPDAQPTNTADVQAAMEASLMALVQQLSIKKGGQPISNVAELGTATPCDEVCGSSVTVDTSLPEYLQYLRERYRVYVAGHASGGESGALYSMYQLAQLGGITTYSDPDGKYTALSQMEMNVEQFKSRAYDGLTWILGHVA